MIYLASKSKRRKELLKTANIKFRVVRSDFRERTFPGGPEKTVVMNALGKIRHARVKAKSGIVLGADTIVYCRKHILGKPKSRKDAFVMLKRLVGTTHNVFTGIALIDLASGHQKTACIKSRVTMRRVSDREITSYFSKVNPLDKAGAYAIQEHGDQLIKKIRGSYTNVVGLPMEKLKTLLKKFQKEKKT